jgi:hypothetical protein
MQDILKPMGLLALLIAIVSLASLAIFNRRTVTVFTPAKTAAPPKSVAPTATPAESVVPTEVRNEAPIGNGWTVKTDGKTLQQDQLGDEYREFALEGAMAPKIAPDNGKYVVTMKADTMGTNRFSKYGVRVYTSGPIGFVEGWIDPKYNVLATCGRGLAWKNVPLPAGFNMSEEHTITMEWKDKGNIWSVTVDDDPSVSQMRNLGRECPAQRVSLMTQDTAVTYSLQR